MNWADAEDAIRDWIAGTPGLAAALWEAQSAAIRPAKPFASLRVIALGPAGQDWVEVDDADPEAPLYQVSGQRQGLLRVTCFASSGTGSLTAVALLERAVTRLRLPSVAGALAGAGVSLVPAGPATSVDAVIRSAEFEPRATAQFHLFATSSETEVGQVIETVEVGRLEPEPTEIRNIPHDPPP